MGGSSEYIMLVDDDKENLSLMTNYLLKYGARVATAIHSIGCFDYTEQCNDLDMRLLDLHMPLMGGLEAIPRIREQPGYQSFPLLVLTVDDTVGVRNECISLGTNDFLFKPISREAFIETICIWLSNTDSDKKA